MYTIAEVLEQAMRLHQSGKFAQAEPLYRQVIDADPANAQAAHMLGLLARQTGHHQSALTLIRRAITLNPTAPAFHFNLGLVHKEQGQFAEAAGCFRAELALNPNHADSLNNLGIVLVGQGQVVEAIAAYLQALRINPNYADVHNNLGVARILHRQTDEGIKCFRDALRLDPKNVNAHVNLGNAFKEQGHLADAISSYRAALQINPGLAGAHNNLGLALLSQRQPAEAADCFREALRINPKYANAHNNLGNALKDLGQLPQAVECYRRALEIKPDNANALNNLGNALVEQGELADATESYLLALRCNPNHADVHNNLGIALEAQGQLAEAIECFDKTLSLNPSHRMGLWNRACLRLLQGDFRNGWAGYEHRWLQPDMVPRNFGQPRWDGGPLNGQTILVHAEQGLGDTIQFLRYLPLVKQRGGTIVLECQAVLCKLLAGYPGVREVVAAGDSLPPFDVHIPLLSLPGVFGTTLDNMPADVPYLAAKPERIEHWRGQLEGIPGGKVKVGIVWQGSMNLKGDRRSAALPHFAALARHPDVQLVSLQVPPGSDQLTSAPFPVIDLGTGFDPGSLDDLAAAIMSTDLVVTVDTAAAHLAGALGVPVWVALALSADWRWLLERSDNPWYPTMRLFRQQRLGDWAGVFERIDAALAGWKP